MRPFKGLVAEHKRIRPLVTVVLFRLKLRARTCIYPYGAYRSPREGGRSLSSTCQGHTRSPACKSLILDVCYFHDIVIISYIFDIEMELALGVVRGASRNVKLLSYSYPKLWDKYL